MTGRLEHQDDIKFVVEDTLKDKTMDEAVQLLLSKGIPAGPIYDISQIMADPQVKDREMFVQMNHPTLGNITVNGCAIKLSDTPAAVRHPAPALGQDNLSVLNELLGIDSQSVLDYKNRGII
jgi:CoA:oxalate CoA-transferase